VRHLTAFCQPAKYRPQQLQTHAVMTLNAKQHLFTALNHLKFEFEIFLIEISNKK